MLEFRPTSMQVFMSSGRIININIEEGRDYDVIDDTITLNVPFERDTYRFEALETLTDREKESIGYGDILSVYEDLVDGDETSVMCAYIGVIATHLAYGDLKIYCFWHYANKRYPPEKAINSIKERFREFGSEVKGLTYENIYSTSNDWKEEHGVIVPVTITENMPVRFIDRLLPPVATDIDVDKLLFGATYPKYELTDETIEVDGHTLHRIRALLDFTNVRTRDLGGFVESENNLSHEDNCWVQNNAKVFENARVYGDARVYDDARVYGDAQVYGYVEVIDKARVYGHAQVGDDAVVDDNARVYDYAVVCDNAWVSHNAHVCGDAKISGYGTEVKGYAYVNSGNYTDGILDETTHPQPPPVATDISIEELHFTSAGNVWSGWFEDYADLENIDTDGWDRLENMGNLTIGTAVNIHGIKEPEQWPDYITGLVVGHTDEDKNILWAGKWSGNSIGRLYGPEGILAILLEGYEHIVAHGGGSFLYAIGGEPPTRGYMTTITDEYVDHRAEVIGHIDELMKLIDEPEIEDIDIEFQSPETAIRFEKGEDYGPEATPYMEKGMVFFVKEKKGYRAIIVIMHRDEENVYYFFRGGLSNPSQIREGMESIESRYEKWQHLYPQMIEDINIKLLHHKEIIRDNITSQSIHSSDVPGDTSYRREACLTFMGYMHELKHLTQEPEIEDVDIRFSSESNSSDGNPTLPPQMRVEKLEPGIWYPNKLSVMLEPGDVVLVCEATDAVDEVTGIVVVMDRKDDQMYIFYQSCTRTFLVEREYRVLMKRYYKWKDRNIPAIANDKQDPDHEQLIGWHRLYIEPAALGKTFKLLGKAGKLFTDNIEDTEIEFSSSSLDARSHDTRVKRSLHEATRSGSSPDARPSDTRIRRSPHETPRSALGKPRPPAKSTGKTTPPHSFEALDPKYELTDETIEVAGHTLHRIRALRDFCDVKKGELGGFIESENNLSHGGDGWVFNDARIFENAKVFGDAWISGNAQVYGNARVEGNAHVYGNAQVFGRAQVYGNARVEGNARIFENARLYGSVAVHGDAQVLGNVEITGFANIRGCAYVRSGKHIEGTLDETTHPPPPPVATDIDVDELMFGAFNDEIAGLPPDTVRRRRSR